MSVKIICPKCNGDMRLIHPYWTNPQVQCRNGKCENNQFKLRLSEVKDKKGFDLREANHS